MPGHMKTTCSKWNAFIEDPEGTFWEDGLFELTL